MPDLVPTSDEMERRRQEVIDELTQFYSTDRISTEDFEARMELVQRAKTTRELRSVVRDLTGESEESHLSYRSQSNVEEGENMICVLGDQSHQVSLVAERPNIVTVLGDQKIYIQPEDIPAGVSEIKLFTLLGDTKIYVPPGVRVESKIAAILGDVKGRRKSARVNSSERVIQLVGTCILGSVRVKTIDFD